MTNERFAITISHQIGSGGSDLGKKLSERLSAPFIDRQVLQWMANQLHLSEAEVEGRDQRVSTFWQSFSQVAAYTDPMTSFAPNPYVPSDKDFFQLESDYIGRIIEQTSAIILGRCGWYVLRDHPRHLSVLVHATMPDRIQRVHDLFHLSDQEAVKFIENNDKERATYVHTFTKQNWLAADNYDLCVDTTTVGLDKTVDLVVAAFEAKIH